jgi:hypothetical protein
MSTLQIVEQAQAFQLDVLRNKVRLTTDLAYYNPDSGRICLDRLDLQGPPAVLFLKLWLNQLDTNQCW